MYVGLKMLRDFVTVTSDTPVKEAAKILEDNQLWMLLVREGEELVGYVTKEDVRAAMPAILVSLDKQEINDLLSKLTVKSVLRKDITTVPPETEIEAAADLMYEMNLSGLAVSNDKKDLIGYVNRDKMLEVLVEEMAHGQGGSRIVIEAEERTGVLYEVAGIISNMKYSIISMAVFFHRHRRMIVVRVETQDPTPISDSLRDRGYTVASADDFKEEWES